MPVRSGKGGPAMTLGFSTHWPGKEGKPTFFAEKTIAGTMPAMARRFDIPKIHTFRIGHRWRAGMAIHMVIRNRTPKRFQFNAFVPSLSTCISEQDAVVGLDNDDDLFIIIGTFEQGYYLSKEELLLFAVNDGFNSLEELQRWFFPKGFDPKRPYLSGQIIHWTDFQYEILTAATAPEKG